MNFPSCQWRGMDWLYALAICLLPSHSHSQTLRWTNHDGYRSAELAVPVGNKTGFTLLKPGQTGLFFTNEMSYARSEANQNLINGCGVAAGDFDGDGWCDLYFANTDAPNGLFRNQGGWKFQNVTETAGVGCGTNSASKGAVFADANGDGWLDLLVGMLGGPNAYFQNLGDGRFTNLTTTAGITVRLGTHSVAMSDIDGDGDLDLYLANYGENSILRSGGSFSTRMVNGKPVVTGRWAKRLKIIDGRIVELGEPDSLFLNDGNGRFSPVSWTGGSFLNVDGQPLKSEPYDMGLSVIFRDINGDGAPDIYVCNDFQAPDRIWINDGTGRFRALADQGIRTTCQFSMGVDFADIDRDGFDDIFVGDMLSRVHELRLRQSSATNPPPAESGETWDRRQARQNTLQINRGDGTYANIAAIAGVAASDWTWSVVFLDVDLDGFEDLLVANAHGYDTQDLDMHESMPQESGGALRIGKQLRMFPPLITPNYLFRNRGNRTFEETGAAWGFHSTNVSHGIALADFDLDGDLDIAVSCLWQPPLLYRNESTAPRVAVRLRGAGRNTRGIGAKIKLLGGAVPAQSQEIHCGGRYLSADDTMRVFAAGTLTNQMSIEVAWRSGHRSVVHGAKANHIYEIVEPAGPAPGHPKPAPVADIAPLFQNVSESLHHIHGAVVFSDFERQPLLPRSLSRLGPGVAWSDLDGDGRDELIIGGDAGTSPAIFGHDGRGKFSRWESSSGNALNTDLAGFANWVPAPGQRALLAGQFGLRTPDSETAPLARIFPKNVSGTVTAAVEIIPGLRPSKTAGGPISVADVDGDGDLDVFIGGRVVPGRYPESAASQLLINDRGTLRPDAAAENLLKQTGLVSGATFSDLDGDGAPELLLACEWGPLRIFRNRAGRLTEWNAPLTVPGEAAGSTLSQWTGWWTSVTTGDFDGDGRLDIAAGNWGLNTPYGTPTPARPVTMFYGDFDGNGSVDLLEAELDSRGRLAPRRDMMILGSGWPELRTRFSNHKLFSVADIPEVLGPHQSGARPVSAATLRSVVLLNRGDRFELMPLPEAAQYAPLFGLTVADFDGDGREDLFAAQNFFLNRPEDSRHDAGRGLLLLGEGQGRFRAVEGHRSGILLYGEQRGTAAGDFDEDGRTDLAVAQHSATTALLRNATARPGLRVRLNGLPPNPDGLGATITLHFGKKTGPAREIHGGSGYWSQDSVVAVMSVPETPTEVIVRWPGGKQTSSSIPAGAREITVAMDGTVKANK